LIGQRLKRLLAGRVVEGRLSEVMRGCGSCAVVGRWRLSAVGGWGLGVREG